MFAKKVLNGKYDATKININVVVAGIVNEIENWYPAISN